MAVDDGIVIINEATARISTGGGPEVFVTINGTDFVNLRRTLNKHPGIVKSQLLNIVGHDPVLSIPFLHRQPAVRPRFQGRGGRRFPQTSVRGWSDPERWSDWFIHNFFWLSRKRTFNKNQRIITSLI